MGWILGDWMGGVNMVDFPGRGEEGMGNLVSGSCVACRSLGFRDKSYLAV